MTSLLERAGTKFDPRIVAVMTQLGLQDLTAAQIPTDDLGAGEWEVDRRSDIRPDVVDALA